MIKGMANAGRIFKRGDWIRSAMLSVDFIQSELWKDGCLFASYKDDKVHLKAYLDDYAFMLDSLLELMQAEFRQTDLNFAVALAETLLEKFEDKEAGGFSLLVTITKNSYIAQNQVTIMLHLPVTE